MRDNWFYGTQYRNAVPLREATRIGEKDRRDIEHIIPKGEQFAQPTIRRIFDDIKNPVDGATLAQAERMRMSLYYMEVPLESPQPPKMVEILFIITNDDTDGIWAANNNVLVSDGDPVDVKLIKQLPIQ